jgi:hypothetical protein
VAEAMVGYAPGASLGEQPGVGDAEQFACGFRVDQPCERVRTVVGSRSVVLVDAAPAVYALVDAGACAVGSWGEKGCGERCHQGLLHGLVDMSLCRLVW